MNGRIQHLAGRILPLALIGLALLAVWRHPPPAGGAAPVRLQCADLVAGCATRLDGRTVWVAMAGRVKPLQPFELRVRAPGAARVLARFTMADMDMGFNQHSLRPDADGVFRASVTLPACVSGHGDWTMTLEVDGRALELPFVTEL